jgi:two-component system OmpR family sensor kinase
VIEDMPDVEVNAGAMELCLTNYVSNAIKYSDPSRSNRWVRLKADVRQGDGGADLVIAVEDNGLGVPEEAREKLFSRFYRAHGTITGVEGTGLGLSIVRDTVESLGGRAWAEFDAPAGSRFRLAVPCRRAADRERRGGAATAPDR